MEKTNNFLQSPKEKKIRKITQLYYSRPDIQEIIFEFSKNREISPRYFEGFGKRPDSLQFKGDVLSLAKKGATSFHCSEELWEDPLKIETGMSKTAADEIRIGWDLLIDIDCKWFDYSKLATKSIIESFRQHGIKNIGVKFSGNKGFHILIPWKAFPKKVNDIEIKNLFPELPRTLIAYIRNYSEKIMKEKLPENFHEQFKKTGIKKGIKCIKCGEIADSYEETELFCSFCKTGEIKKIYSDEEKIFKCPECKREMERVSSKKVYHCPRCDITSKFDPKKDLEIKRNDPKFRESEEYDLFDIMGLDLVLTSPRHLFRMPYSLHEKTALVSVVISPDEVDDFDMKKADPMKIEVRNFMPDSEEGEAKEFVMQALDWSKTEGRDKENQKKISGKYENFKSIKLENLNDSQFPPTIKKILEGVGDGRKRALFVLINFFRSIGFEKDELEKRIFEWNKKNEVPLKLGYITSQLSWSYNHKIIPPPNFDKDYYKGIGAVPDSEEKNLKNPVNYVVRKNFLENSKNKNKSKS